MLAAATFSSIRTTLTPINTAAALKSPILPRLISTTPLLPPEQPASYLYEASIPARSTSAIPRSASISHIEYFAAALPQRDMKATSKCLSEGCHNLVASERNAWVMVSSQIGSGLIFVSKQLLQVSKPYQRDYAEHTPQLHIST